MKSEKGWAIYDDMAGLLAWTSSTLNRKMPWVFFLLENPVYQNKQDAKECGYQCIPIVIKYEDPKQRKVKK